LLMRRFVFAAVPGIYVGVVTGRRSMRLLIVLLAILSYYDRFCT
jgi:hypothetical protein